MQPNSFLRKRIVGSWAHAGILHLLFFARKLCIQGCLPPPNLVRCCDVTRHVKETMSRSHATDVQVAHMPQFHRNVGVRVGRETQNLLILAS